MATWRAKLPLTANSEMILLLTNRVLLGLGRIQRYEQHGDSVLRSQSPETFGSLNQLPGALPKQVFGPAGKIAAPEIELQIEKLDSPGEKATLNSQP
jgi:hypothetical protein